MTNIREADVDSRELMSSSYFAVRDKRAFLKFCKARGVMVSKAKRKPKLMGSGRSRDQELFSICSDDWNPDANYDVETGEELEIEFLTELCTHIQPGWIAIINSIANNQLFAIGGDAWALDSNGRREMVSTNDIHAKAEKMGGRYTPALWFEGQ